MNDTVNGSGSCLCGAVEFTASDVKTHIGACHCGMCRKWGGGPLLAVDCGADVNFSDTDNIAVYASSEWAERGFCKQCGSHLFYRFKGNGTHMMAAGLFDDDSVFVLDHQVFVDNKPEYYSFAEKTHDMTEAEILAEFAPSPAE